MPQPNPTKAQLQTLRVAALDCRPVAGLTHNFYRYPARFSPEFASAAIALFSKPGQLVLDPYMGGGTTIVEALTSGRKAAGADLNELSDFVVRAKTTPLTRAEIVAVKKWAKKAVAEMHFRSDPSRLEHLFDDDNKTKNLHWPSARPVKKALAGAMLALDSVKSSDAQAFVRCVLLRLGQWALDGRQSSPPLGEIRAKLPVLVEEMLAALVLFSAKMKGNKQLLPAHVFACDASRIDALPVFADGTKADLVVTSPPYPGVHMLYHRWQINGRREAPAPYWLANCDDGHGASYYNFADRRSSANDRYFEVSLMTLKAVRKVLKDGAFIVQMVAFGDPAIQLPAYIENMELADFEEFSPSKERASRIWRSVPGRKWHAALKGQTSSSREVVLIHRAV